MKKALDRLQHPKPKRPQYAPHSWNVPNYVKILQMTPDPDDRILLENKSAKKILYLGTMLYYSLSVDPMMSLSINGISRVQSKLTKDTEKKVKMLLDYAATYPNSIICYKDIT